MISDTLSDAVFAIDEYLSDSTLYQNKALRREILIVRDAMDTLRIKLDSALPTKTIWESDGKDGEPLLITTPPAGWKSTELDHPKVRASTRCFGPCHGHKPVGLVVCWGCYHDTGLKYGNSEMERILDEEEARL